MLALFNYERQVVFLSEETNPLFPEVNAEKWIERHIGTTKLGDERENAKQQGNITAVVDSDRTFVFPVYGRVPEPESEGRRMRDAAGRLVTRRRMVRDIVHVVRVEIPAGTRCTIFRPYETVKGRYVASFFLDNAIINVLGGGIIKRRDLVTKRYELLS